MQACEHMHHKMHVSQLIYKNCFIYDYLHYFLMHLRSSHKFKTSVNFHDFHGKPIDRLRLIFLRLSFPLRFICFNLFSSQ